MQSGVNHVHVLISGAWRPAAFCTGILSYIVFVAHLMIGCPHIQYMDAQSSNELYWFTDVRSSNELQWLDLKILHHDRRPGNGCQLDILYCSVRENFECHAGPRTHKNIQIAGPASQLHVSTVRMNVILTNHCWSSRTCKCFICQSTPILPIWGRGPEGCHWAQENECIITGTSILLVNN